MDEEERNYCCLALLLLRVGNSCLRLCFKNQWDAAVRYAPWTDCAQNGADLLRMFKPLPYEKNKVQSGDSSTWDLSLFAKVLLRSRPPFVTAPNLVTALKTLQELRNDLCHSPLPRLTTPDFQKAWTDACAALSLFGAVVDDFDKVEEDVTKPWSELLLIMKHCADQEKVILDALKPINSKMKKLQQGQQTIQEGQSGLQQGQRTIQEGQSRLQQGQHTIQEGLSGLQQGLAALSSKKQCQEELCDSHTNDYTDKLKSSIRRQTEFLLMSEGKRTRTDDIFTNVTIERGQKHFQKPNLKSSIRRQTEFLLMSEGKRTRTDGFFSNVTIKPGPKHFQEDQDRRESRSTTLKNCSEMFICSENDQKSTTTSTSNTKSILLTGKAGIGKSLFCQKLVRDWADNKLFEKGVENTKLPDIQFALLLTFRQLSLLGNKKLDLRDVLNRCSLLDGQSIIDKAILQNIIQNPDKLLIIFDGYDEYKHRKEITGDFETKYPNDPCQKIPVPALIAKIMKGKMLKESVVVVSSRPGEGDALKAFHFDVRCEIKGFSSHQVIKYVEKYFRDDESMKKAVINHIEANEILKGFGHIPVMCFLMCQCIEWHITQGKTTKNLPVTRTELYHEVIKLFLQKHSSSKYEEMKETELQAILYKLAELAVSLMKEKKYIFNENDMKRFKLTDEEINNLKASGLFDCCPAVKTSPSEKTKLEFMFTHLTLQEFLCAFQFVEKKKKLPKRKKTSDVTFMFMAGLLSRKKDEKLMKQLLKKIKPKDDMNKVLTLQCLYEYRDDELSKRVIHNLHDKYCDGDGRIHFSRVSDIDCVGISYLIHIIGLLNEEQTKQHATSTQSFIVKALYISSSMLSPSGVRMLCDSLVSISTLTVLMLWDCHLDDKCIEIICNSLMSCTITRLHLSDNNITDVGATSICEALIHNECHVRRLYLYGNNKITAECKKSVRKLVQQHKPGVGLYLDESDYYK